MIHTYHPQPLPSERRPRTLGAAIFCLSVAAVFLASLPLSGCSATADAHLRASTGIADGAARVWATATPAEQRALFHRARRALWTQRVLRLDELPEDPALRAELEQLKAKGAE